MSLLSTLSTPPSTIPIFPTSLSVLSSVTLLAPPPLPPLRAMDRCRYFLFPNSVPSGGFFFSGPVFLSPLIRSTSPSHQQGDPSS